MKFNLKNLFAVALIAVSASFVSSCSSDDDSSSEEIDLRSDTLRVINKYFVEETVQKTYENLSGATNMLIVDIEGFDKSRSQSDLDKAADEWKEARQYWEWSEAFLFGVASGYSIDPHIDTWPFDAATFNIYMSKYHPATNEADAAILEEAIAKGESLTGFHAIEYLLFRNGSVRKAEDLTDDEIWFCLTAANDLYLAASKLVLGWNGELTSYQEQILEDNEVEEDEIGNEFCNAGTAGSRWKTALAASVQILAGCQDIIDEVAHSKIGSAYTGDDTNYIESPHAYNSITDFYDNIISCKNALYGFTPSLANYTNNTPTDYSLMAYCQKNYPTQATAAMSALENALTKINNMKRPFVLYYSDPTAGEAITALEALSKSLTNLQEALEK